MKNTARGVYFEQYVNKEENELSPKVVQALGHTPIITAKMWQDLKEQVQQYGLYHSYRLAIAPTGSISYIRSCTASISPVTERVEVRDYADSRTIYPMPFLTNDNKDHYTEAYEVNPYELIDLYATAQKHIDQAVCLQLFL